MRNENKTNNRARHYADNRNKGSERKHPSVDAHISTRSDSRSRTYSSRNRKKSKMPLVVTFILLLLLVGVGILVFVTKGFGIFDAENADDPLDNSSLTTDSSQLSIQPAISAAQEQEEQQITESYDINGITFSLPKRWSVVTQTDYNITFSLGGESTSHIEARCENLPPVVTMQGVETSIIDKNDTIAYATSPLTSDLRYEIKSEFWSEKDGIEYFERFYAPTTGADTVDETDGVIRCIVIPIDSIDGYFYIEVSDSEYYSDLDIVLSSIYGISQEEKTSAPPIDEEDEVSQVEKAYRKACSLTIADLDEKRDQFGNTSYFYGDLIILSEDEEWLTASNNTNHSLNQGALYRTIAKYLKGFSIGLNNGSNYADILSGTEWTSKEAFEPYVSNASEFIVMEGNTLEPIMRKFESLQSATGVYDFDSGQLGTYEIDIQDLSACAKEMMISERMLGYIFAMLDEYAVTITFEGNGCHIEYAGF